MDWELTCRICLESGDMVSLFDSDENNELLRDKFTFCCGIEISEDDSLPVLICLPCVDRLMASYKFKQQCLNSHETLKECLLEFQNTSALAENQTEIDGRESPQPATEVISIKQENGTFLQYELPVEHVKEGRYNSNKQYTINRSAHGAVVTSAPPKRGRGRPRKYPDATGAIVLSPYELKVKEKKESPSLTTLIESGQLKQEPEGTTDDDDQENVVAEYLNQADDDDPDFDPAEEDNFLAPEEPSYVPKKRGRPRKYPPNTSRMTKKPKEEVFDNDGEDVLLKETIMAFSEPIPEHILNPRPKTKRKFNKKKYHYEKTHTCETCGSSFTSNASLQAHIRRHLGIKPFVCSVCGYSCVLSMELKRHMLRHTGIKPYKCRVCERRFGDFGSRQKHERLHMGVRPYQCSLCGKSFTYSYVLSNHMLTHTGEKKFACEPCNKKFTKAHHLKYHNKVHHKDVYLRQQLEQEQKKMRRQIQLVGGYGGVLTGEIVDGTLQLVHTQPMGAAGDEDNGAADETEVLEDAAEEGDGEIAGERDNVDEMNADEVDADEVDADEVDADGEGDGGMQVVESDDEVEIRYDLAANKITMPRDMPPFRIHEIRSDMPETIISDMQE